MRKHHARAAYMAMQQRTLAWYTVHALVSCHAPLLRPTTIQLITPTQCTRLMPSEYWRSVLQGSSLEHYGFVLVIAVLAITSHLCIRVAVQNMNSTLQLAYPCVCLLGVARAAWLWRQCHPREKS